METRSKSQSGRNESNMAEQENHSTGKATLIKSTTKKAKYQEQHEHELDNAEADNDNDLSLNEAIQYEKGVNAENNAIKGLVASRIEQINNTPLNSPVATKSASKTKKKLRMVGAKDGKLSMEEESVDVDFDKIIDDHAEPSKEGNNSSDSLVLVLKDLAATVKRLESKMDNMEKDRKVTKKEVRQMTIVQSQDSAALTDLTKTVDNQQDEIKMLVGVVSRQQQQIDDLTYKLNNLYTQNNSKKLTISGLAETQGENCFHEVANFFKNIMKIEKQIPLKLAKRIGTGTNRAMLIKLQHFEHKTLIFQKFDRLKQANRSRNNPYFISDQLPEAWAERRRFVQHIKFQNSKLPTQAQHNVAVARGTIMIDDQEYQPPMTAPGISDLFDISLADKAAIQAVEVTEGDPETLNQSVFQGYATEAFSAEQVRKQYLHLKTKHPNATHLMAAYRIPGTDFTNNQGVIDDGEHGGGRALMKVLFKEKSENTAVFVARYYGGKHLGVARFQAIEKAAKSAMDKATEAIRKARRPPSAQELAQINFQIQQETRQQQQPKEWGEDSDVYTEDSQSADSD